MGLKDETENKLKHYKKTKNKNITIKIIEVKSNEKINSGVALKDVRWLHMLTSGRGLGAESEEERESKERKYKCCQSWVLGCPLMTRAGQW